MQSVRTVHKTIVRIRARVESSHGHSPRSLSLSHSMRLLFAPLVFIFRDYIVLSNVDDDNDDDRCNSGSYNHNGIDDD